VGILTAGGDEESEKSEPDATAEVDHVAHRLERIRELDFKRIPPVRTVTEEEAREEGLAQLDKDYPPKRRAADEQVLILLGLLPEGSDIRELAGTIFGEEVAGYYDDEKKQMTLVGGSGQGTEGEITLAHELTHALEDQHFRLGEGEAALDDETTAHTALTEGTATVAMLDYTARFLTGGVVGRQQILAQLQATNLIESDSGLPPYLQHSLLFPYSAGARFVDAIGTWGPANRALRGRGPLSTEQILHPDKYGAGERPLRVAMPRPPGPGWKKAASGTIGEFDTAELIRSSDSPARAERAAAGWGGGSYALWRNEHARPDYTLNLAWRWDTPRDAAEFVAELPRYIERTLKAKQSGPGIWDTPEGNTVVVKTGPTVRLSIGPAK
jgi:hypothetical protein